jgi:hypothetical protein
VTARATIPRITATAHLGKAAACVHDWLRVQQTVRASNDLGPEQRRGPAAGIAALAKLLDDYGNARDPGAEPSWCATFHSRSPGIRRDPRYLTLYILLTRVSLPLIGTSLYFRLSTIIAAYANPHTEFAPAAWHRR